MTSRARRSAGGAEPTHIDVEPILVAEVRDQLRAADRPDAQLMRREAA